MNRLFPQLIFGSNGRGWRGETEPDGRALVAFAAAAPAADTPEPDGSPAAEKIRRFLHRLGPWAPAIFVLLFVLACVVCIPTVPLTIAAGGVWGVAQGLLWVWIGVLFGSAAGFLIGRHWARDWVMRRLAPYPRLRAIEQAVSDEGWRIVVLARLAPGSPFFLLNYAFGLTRIGFWEHLAATALSTLPGSLLFVYLGSLGVMALEGRIRTVWDWLLLGIGLLALAWGVRLIARRSRRILDARLARGPNDSKP